MGKFKKGLVQNEYLVGLDFNESVYGMGWMGWMVWMVWIGMDW